MSKPAQYLLAALIIAMVASSVLLQRSAVAFYSPEGGDPVTTAVLASTFVVFGAGALIVKRRN